MIVATLKHQARVSRRRGQSRKEPGAAQQHRAADTMKEVAERQQVRSRQRRENLQNNRREHKRDAMRMPDEERNRPKHTERKNSRTSSNEDKVEKQDIMSEGKVGNVDMKT